MQIYLKNASFVSSLSAVPFVELLSFFVWQGKFIRINFDVNGYIVGANIETCILFLRGAFHTCDTTGSTCWVDGLQAKVNHPRVSWLTVMISLSFIWLNEVTVLGKVLFPRCARPWPQPDQICWKSLGPSVKRKRSGASTSSTTCCRGPAKNCAVRDFPAFPRFPSQLSRTKNHLCRKWQCLICCWVCCSGGMWRHHSDTKDAFTAQ